MGLPVAAGQSPDYSGELGKGDLHKEIMEKYQTGLDIRMQLEPNWYIQREFYRGNQYVTWDQRLGILSPLNDPKWAAKPRLIWNKSRAIVESYLAFLLRSEPTFGVMAKTGEGDDQAAAMTARKVLYHYWTLLNCGEKLERTGLWAATACQGLWKISWDPTLGPKLPQVERRMIQPPIPPELAMQMQAAMASGMPAELPPEFQPQEIEVTTGYVQGGEVRVDVVSPVEFVPDCGAETLEDCEYAIHATRVPIEEMKRRYPQFADKFEADETDSRSAYGRMMLQSHGSNSGFSSSTRQQNRCTVMELWSKPTSKYGEEGLRAVATTKFVCDVGGTPRGHNHIPFAAWCDRIVPGEYWGDATMKDQVPLQKELNKRLSQLVDIANKFRVKYMAVAGSVSEDQINDEDGEIIEHAPGQRPEPVNPPGMPEVPVRLMEMTSSAMEDTSGIQSVMQGRMQGQGDVRSGRQVAYLQQYGETRIGLLAKHLSRFLERSGKLILELAQANVTEERIGRIVGKNRQMEAFSFKGADIKGNTDVVVETDSLLGFSKSERFDKLMSMAQQQIIGPEKVLEMMEMSDWYAAVEPKAQDRNVAMRENENWRTGKPNRPPFYFEDHIEHLATINSFRKTATYEQLPPDLRANCDEHAKGHETFLVPPQPAQPPPGGEPGNPAGPSSPGQPGEAPPEGDYQSAAVRESGQEIAEGLPLVAPVPGPGPGTPEG